MLSARDLKRFRAFKVFKKALLLFKFALVSLLEIFGKRHKLFGLGTFVSPSEMILCDL